MKRIASVAIGLGAIAITLIPVSAANTPTDQSVTPGIGRVGHLTFQGSTTVGPIIQAAASAYNTAKGSTIILNDTTNIVQNGSGFGQNAITLTIGDGAALGHIATDIGMSSGVVNTTTFSDVQSTAIARDGMVFIVNETSADWTGHKILNVTVGQIDDIYEGRVNNWNQITDPITGVVGPTLAIGVRAREIGSGTRNSWKDSVGLTQTDSDSSPAANTENYVIVNSGFGRLTAMADMQNAINASTASGQCGYVGLGDSTGTGITFTAVNLLKNTLVKNGTGTITAPTNAGTAAAGTQLKPGANTVNVATAGTVVVTTPVGTTGTVTSGTATVTGAPVSLPAATATTVTVSGTGTIIVTLTMTVSYAPNGVNIYSGNYPFSRFLWLMTNTNATTGSKSFANYANITDFITWMRTTDGAGQAAVKSVGFLPLYAAQDVTTDGKVDVLDLIGVGNKVGSPATGAGRANVTGKTSGNVDVLDLIAVGNWVGTTFTADPTTPLP